MFGPVIDELIDALRCLPGVGPKSAQRMALHLLDPAPPVVYPPPFSRLLNG